MAEVPEGGNENIVVQIEGLYTDRLEKLIHCKRSQIFLVYSVSLFR